MAAYRGRDCDVLIGTTGQVAYMDSWTYNGAIGTAEITGYGADSKEFGQTLREWSGSIAGTLDRSDTDQADLLDQFEDGTLASVSVRLYTLSTGTVAGTSYMEYWGGAVKMTGVTVGSNVADKVAVSFTFQGTSNVSYTTGTDV